MKRIIQIAVFLFLDLTLLGQQTPVTNQYILNPILINSSYAGNRGGMSIAGFYRRQWVGITGAPQNISFEIDAPILSSKLGLGLLVVNDKVGVTEQTRMMSAYSYKIRVKKGNLSFGLGAGILATNTTWSDLIVLDPGDENYLIDSKVFVVPDFNFGIYYTYAGFFASLSIPRLLSYEFDFKSNKYSFKALPDNYDYVLNTGYMFNLSPNLRFLPSGLISFSKNKMLLYDLNAHLIFFDRFWLGASYRSTSSVTGLIQFAVNDQLKVAYSYDFDFGQLGRFSRGSHEVMLRYELKYRVDVVNPLIF